MNKTVNQKAWFFVLPVLMLVAFNAIVPLMTVVNYSVQDILGFNSRFFVGFEWYRETLRETLIIGEWTAVSRVVEQLVARHGPDPLRPLRSAVDSFRYRDLLEKLAQR